MLVPFAEGGPNHGQDAGADRLTELEPDGHDGGQGPFQSAPGTDHEEHAPAATSRPKGEELEPLPVVLPTEQPFFRRRQTTPVTRCKHAR